MSKNKLISPLAVITGASRGIGRSVAEGFAKAGFDIFAVARTLDHLIDMKKAFSSTYSSKLYTQATDLSQRTEAEALAEEVLKLNRPIEVLINNAGAFVPGSLLDKEDHLPHQIATNLYSAYYLTRKLLPSFLAQNRGYIFNICSVASLQPYPRSAAYSISKYALRGFSQALRKELLETDVRVSTVLPGAVLTDSWKGTSLPKDRFIQPKDIANLLLSSYSLSSSTTVEEIIIRPQRGDI